ncbi:MAG: sugar transferase [Gammaproteobacteria bacterium]|nr:sugar transferase [bacterium AH-315-E07]PCH60599.1 MAG: sugar transferase [Gammaproteobacteria bacterium]
MQFAPIVLFVYNRLEHVKKTIEALQVNTLAKESILYIYSDASTERQDGVQVASVREYVKTVECFKKVVIIEQPVNRGLADSIIGGVTDIVNRHGRVIVLEDDLVTGRYFLQYMNDVLEMYESDEKVMHISGWNYPIDAKGLESSFLWRNMNCWGWATWSDRWRFFHKDVPKLIQEFTKEQILAFNLDGYNNVWSQVLANAKGRRDTWAIFWYTSIFQKKGLCVNPVKSLVKNIGHDASGIHCVDYDPYSQECEFNRIILNKQPLVENSVAVTRVQGYLKDTALSLCVRAYYRVRSFYRRMKRAGI